MGAENKFLKNNVSVIYRNGFLDAMIYAHILGQRELISGVSVSESAKSFMKLWNIDEGELSMYSIVSIYNRMQKDIINEQKSDSQES